MVRTKITPRKNPPVEESTTRRGRTPIGPRPMTALESRRRLQWRTMLLDFNPFTLRLRWIGHGKSPLGDGPLYDEQILGPLMQQNKVDEEERNAIEEENRQKEIDEKIKKEKEEEELALKVFNTTDKEFILRMKTVYQDNNCKPCYVKLTKCS